MEPEELEFFAEKQMISIVPTFSSKAIHLIAGDVGPFRAGLPLRVPLWLALNLKQQQKCKIRPPDWMTLEVLEAIKENEKVSRTFTKMPSEHYMIEVKLLLANAPDDIPQADGIRTVIKDIWDMRMSKLRASVDALVKSAGSYAAIDHLTALEINAIRPILPHTLDQLYRMKKSSKLSGLQSQNTTTTFGTTHSRPSITPFRSSH